MGRRVAARSLRGSTRRAAVSVSCRALVVPSRPCTGSFSATTESAPTNLQSIVNIAMRRRDIAVSRALSTNETNRYSARLQTERSADGSQKRSEQRVERGLGDRRSSRDGRDGGLRLFVERFGEELEPVVSHSRKVRRGRDRVDFDNGSRRGRHLPEWRRLRRRRSIHRRTAGDGLSAGPSVQGSRL